VDPLAVIQRLGSGRLLEEMVEALQATADEVVRTGKPGTVTLKLTVSNREQGDPMVTIDESLSRASPKRDPRGAIFFAVDGALHREDPRQYRLTFREVDKATGEVRTPSNGDREERVIDG
jgi:hypothetical protein